MSFPWAGQDPDLFYVFFMLIYTGWVTWHFLELPPHSPHSSLLQPQPLCHSSAKEDLMKLRELNPARHSLGGSNTQTVLPSNPCSAVIWEGWKAACNWDRVTNKFCVELCRLLVSKPAPLTHLPGTDLAALRADAGNQAVGTRTSACFLFICAAGRGCTEGKQGYPQWWRL